MLVAFGGSATLGEQLGLPMRDHLVEMTAAGVERSLPRDKYYIPGSLLRVAVDNTNPVAWGMEREVDVMFDNSPVLHLGPEASLQAGASGGVVRRQVDAALGLGLGPALSRRRRGGGVGAAGPRQGVPLRAGDHLPRAAARHVQVPVQQHLRRRRAAERRAPAGDAAAAV